MTEDRIKHSGTPLIIHRTEIECRFKASYMAAYK